MWLNTVLVLIAMLLCARTQRQRASDSAVEGVTECEDAPTTALQKVCRQMSKWDIEANRPQAFAGLPVAAPPVIGPMDCTDWRCVCRASGRILSKTGDHCWINNNWHVILPATRKEYRMMSDKERQRFHAALNRLKQNGDYDKMVRQHSIAALAPGAHSGPAFLPWHREFLKRLEIMLKSIDVRVALPYWDSRLDEPLPNPSDSSLWSTEFLGATNSSGFVVDGPFAHWTPTDDKRRIRRNLGLAGNLFSINKVARIQERIDYHDLAGRECPIYRDFESLEMEHGLVHLWVGGHMFDQGNSPNDPAFFAHHAFVDYIWEEWRQRHQNRSERERQYTHSPCRNAHALHAVMTPFGPPRTNADGLRNAYTDHMYVYEPTPTCGQQKGDCGSKHLFCDLRLSPKPRCVAKIRLNGNCRGFESIDVCVNGASCVAGVCTPVATLSPLLPSSRAPSPLSSPSLPINLVTPDSAVIDGPGEACYNFHPCCLHWSQSGACDDFSSYTLSNCRASCGHCSKPQEPVRGEGCIDIHPNCAAFVRQGHCKQFRVWMMENCHRSCNWCQQSKFDLCVVA